MYLMYLFFFGGGGNQPIDIQIGTIFYYSQKSKVHQISISKGIIFGKHGFYRSHSFDSIVFSAKRGFSVFTGKFRIKLL